MNKFNKLFITTILVCIPAPFLILVLPKLKIILVTITIVTLLLVIGIFHLIDKIHPILLFGRFNLSKFNKNLFIFSLTMFILLMTSLGIELILKDKELLDKLSKTEKLGANITTYIFTIYLVIWCMIPLFKQILHINSSKKYYRKCTIKSKAEIEGFNTGYELFFDVELDTPIDKEKHFKFLTKQLELKDILKENQKIIINGELGRVESEQENGSIQVYKSINGEIVNKDFSIKHKFNSLKIKFKNFKSKGANK